MAAPEREKDEHDPPSDISYLSLHAMDSLKATRICDAVITCCEEDEDRAETFRDRLLRFVSSIALCVDIAMHYEVAQQEETEQARTKAIAKNSVQQWFYISENSLNDLIFMLNVENHLLRSTSLGDNSFIPVWSKPKDHFHRLPFGLNAYSGVCATEKDVRLKRSLKLMLGSEHHQMKKKHLREQQDKERKRWKEVEEILEQERRRQEERHRQSMTGLHEDIYTATLGKDGELSKTRPQVASQSQHRKSSSTTSSNSGSLPLFSSALPRSSTPARSPGTSSSYTSFSSPGSSSLPSSLFSSPNGSLPQHIHHFNITINNPQNVTIGGEAAGVIENCNVTVHRDYLGAELGERDLRAGNSGGDWGAGNSGGDVGAENRPQDFGPKLSLLDFGRELSEIEFGGRVEGDSTVGQRKDCCDEGIDSIFRATDDCVTLVKSICDETVDERDTQLKQVASTTERMESLNLSETGSAVMQVEEQIDSMTFSSSSFECIDHPTDGEEY